MKRNMLILIMLAMTIASCTTKHNMVEVILLEDYRGYIYFPLKIKTAHQDSMLIMATLEGMLNSLNMGIANTPKEIGRLIHKSWREDGCLFVDSTLFNQLKNISEVRNYRVVDSIYNSLGIERVLYQYLDRYGRLIDPLDDPDLECTYVTYLCFQHDVFFHWENDELMGYFLSRSSDIDYDKIMQTLATIKEKDVPWFYRSESNEDDSTLKD
jgi:hypothetical protein